jgi:hypothetical protein
MCPGPAVAIRSRLAPVVVECQVLANVTTPNLARATAAPQAPGNGDKTPGHSALTTFFATRKSRVQIPPAPLKALVRAISARPKRSHFAHPATRCATQTRHRLRRLEHLAGCEVLTDADPWLVSPNPREEKKLRLRGTHRVPRSLRHMELKPNTRVSASAARKVETCPIEKTTTLAR